ncbi:NUDIX hydrolase [Burkholderia sp. F1]|uniref:NUDIX hydrolase n=1 Tax=Burkholderia sp. F1 TaxID=3366817 RepID=UPI003D741C3A
MQVYAVLYTGTGRFLLGWKLKKGYFFYNSATHAGSIVRNGQALNGADNYALPGGRREGSEAIRAGAAREFQEETAVGVGGYPAVDHSFGNDFGAGYFKVSDTQLDTIYRQIRNVNLVAAANASLEVEHGQITQYSQIHQRYPNSPQDNELETVYVWSAHDQANWNTVLSWQGSNTLGWYYDILIYWRNSVL